VTAASLRDRLTQAGCLLGTFVKSPDPLVVEVLAASGLDVLVFDLEHSALDLRELTNLQRAAETFACPTLVRLPADRLADAGRALEAGVRGIQVSDVRKPDDVQAARRAIRFAPTGDMGLSLTHRAAGFGRTAGRQYVQQISDETVLIAQVESAQGIRALPEMLQLAAGPDLWFFGPTDLAASLGYPGQPEHPEVRQALESAASLVCSAGQAYGIFASTETDAEHWRALGAGFVVQGADLSLLGERARALVQHWQGPAAGTSD
jgi:2-keto-3-deoxy-L-rhamnonate aldolase RhmA